MLLYDPDGARFTFDGSRMDLAREYRDRPRGPFSPELQKVLDRMRTTPMKGRYALIVVKPYRELPSVGSAESAACRLKPCPACDTTAWPRPNGTSSSAAGMT